jgi:uncharacterized short protein YbdD (DUF466 family)
VTDRLGITLSGIARGLRAMLGAPDYEKYVAHIRAAHPGDTPMSREDFLCERMESRYNKPGSRCC